MNELQVFAQRNKVWLWMKPEHTVDEFLLEMDNAANKLESNGVIRLSFKSADINILKTILKSPSASAIGELYWTIQEPISSEDAVQIPELCCNLFSLVFKSDGFNVLDLSTAILSHVPAAAATKRLRMLTIHSSMNGNATQFFSALNESQVCYLDLSSMFFTPQGVALSREFIGALEWYLKQDKLEVLHLAIVDQDDVDVLGAIRNSQRLGEMQLSAQRTRQFGSFAMLPRSLTRLELNYMTMSDDDDKEEDGTQGLCTFLRESNVTHFAVRGVKRLNGDLLAEALLTRSSTLQQVAWFKSDFRLRAALTILELVMLRGNVLKDLFVPGCDGMPFLEALSQALQHEHCQVERLRVDSRCAQIEAWKDGFIPALRHENCRLVHLILTSCYAVNTQAAHGAKLALAEFSQCCKRKRILVLLSSQQVRRLSTRSALRRLPVEMMRLVGAMVFSR